MTRYYHFSSSSNSSYSSSEGSYTSSWYNSSSGYYTSSDDGSSGYFTSSSGYSSSSYHSSVDSSEAEQSSRERSSVYTPWGIQDPASGQSSWSRASTPPPRSASFSGYSGQSSSIFSQPDTPARSVTTPADSSYSPYITKTPVRRWSISESSNGVHSRSTSGTTSMSSAVPSISSANPSKSSYSDSGISNANNNKRYFKSNITPVASSGISHNSSLDVSSKTSGTQSNSLSHQKSTSSSANTGSSSNTTMYSSYSKDYPSKSSFSGSAVSRDSPVGWNKWLKNHQPSVTQSQTESAVSKAVPQKVKFPRELDSKTDSSYIDWNKKQDREKYLDDLKRRESTAESQEEADLIRQYRKEMEGFSEDVTSIENSHTDFLSEVADINNEFEAMKGNLLSMRDKIRAL